MGSLENTTLQIIKEKRRSRNRRENLGKHAFNNQTKTLNISLIKV